MKLHLLKSLFVGMLLLLGMASQRACAQQEALRITSLEARVSNLEHRASDAASGGAAMVLFGAFCALWAQNTGRSAWAWFFLGLIFSVITVLVLLYKNSQDNARRGLAGSP